MVYCFHYNSENPIYLFIYINSTLLTEIYTAAFPAFSLR